MKPLSATLRLQFHSDFTLDHAVSLVPYFAQLGISHLYASPILKARAGSRHGYDVVDPTQVNPERGLAPAWHGADPRHRVQPHGRRRRGQPVVAMPAGLGPA